MLRTNARIIQVLTAINFLAILAFTLGGASVATSEHKAWHWDTISQMVTRKGGLENGFAVFLGFSAMIVAFIINTILFRYEDAKLQLPRYKQFKYAIWTAMIFAFASMIGLGVFSLAVDDDTHTTFAGLAFTLLWAATTLLAYIHRRVLVHPVITTVASVIGGIAGVILAVYSTGDNAKRRVQDNEAYYMEYILVTCMHVVLLTLARIKVSGEYNVSIMLRHGQVGESEHAKTLIL